MPFSRNILDFRHSKSATLGVFSLLEVLLLLLKKNRTFSAFSDKYEWKQWHYVIVIKYFSWTLYCKILFVSIFALLIVKF